MVLRRKRMPEALRLQWERFQAQAERVESARRVLLGCLPVGRVDPAPVPAGLDVLVDELEAVRRDLDDWRRAEVEAAWVACRDAIGDALDGVEGARKVATSTGELEELLDAVTDVVEPLDAWADAERAWLSLRTRR